MHRNPQWSAQPTRLARVQPPSLAGAAILLVASALACTSFVRLHALERPIVPHEGECSVRVFEEAELVDIDYEVVGDIDVRGSGLRSTGCEKHEVRAFLQKTACDLRADAIEIYRESHPKAWASCYHVKAGFLRAVSDRVESNGQTS